MIINADVMAGLAQLPDESVQCVVTSPPYWGLRDYGIAGQIGLEPTIEEFVGKMVEVFREVRRVLRHDGTLWLNLGDSYAANRGYQVPDSKHVDVGNAKGMKAAAIGLKPKDLCGIPWRVAFALQADGWYLRQDIIWAKPNPMPESVTDRCTKAHEYIFLLTKSAKYFWDQEAVREESLDTAGVSRIDSDGRKHYRTAWKDNKGQDSKTMLGSWANKYGSSTSPNGRNRRSVWTIATQAYPEAHFATFPEALVAPCIQAGTSEHGYCPNCGAPWVRVVEKVGGLIGKGWTDHKDDFTKGTPQCFRADGGNEPYQVKSLGFAPVCKCLPADPIPCIVLDPFFGSGTVGLVAKKLNRQWIGIEINPEYCKMALKRINAVHDSLFMAQTAGRLG